MFRILSSVLVAFLLSVGLPVTAISAEPEKSDKEKSYYGTVLAVNKDTKILKLIGNDGSMVDLAAEDKAAKHLDKIPLNSLIDITVEMRDGALPVIKSWKMAQAQSSCRIFDGKMCTP